MFNQTMIVFFKELKCIIRDKKTFIFSLLLPLLLVPTMLTIVSFSMKNMIEGQVSGKINVGVNHNKNSFYNFLDSQDNITITDASDPTQALNSGKISAYIAVDENIDQKIMQKEEIKIDVKYNESSINSNMARAIVDHYKAEYLECIPVIETMEDLETLGSLKLPSAQEGDVQNFDMSAMLFDMLVPIMLIMYCFMGSVSIATELSAGEKEKGMLEPLLSTGANRTAIIIGKLLATTAMGVVSGFCTVLGLWGYLVISSGANTLNLSAFEMLTLLVVTLFIAMFFAAINLTIGVYSRSYKEAQTYLTPVSVICLIPTFFTYTLDVGNIGLIYLCVPVLNVVCIIKEIFSKSIDFGHLLIVLGWLILYVATAFLLTSRLFKKESIVFRV